MRCHEAKAERVHDPSEVEDYVEPLVPPERIELPTRHRDRPSLGGLGRHDAEAVFHETKMRAWCEYAELRISHADPRIVFTVS